SVSWVSHELQGYSMRVWMNNGLEMGLQAWDRVRFPPVGLEYPAGSQIEHLSAGAPLVAGIVNGVRHVSSAFLDGEEEFIPEYRHLSKEHFWKTRTGRPPFDTHGWSGYYYNNGNLTNTRGCDDDHDGKID